MVITFSLLLCFLIHSGFVREEPVAPVNLQSQIWNRLRRPSPCEALHPERHPDQPPVHPQRGKESLIDHGVASIICLKLKDIPALFVRWVARILFFKLRETSSGRGCGSCLKKGRGLAPAGRRYPLEESAAPSRW